VQHVFLPGGHCEVAGMIDADRSHDSLMRMPQAALGWRTQIVRFYKIAVVAAGQ